MPLSGSGSSRPVRYSLEKNERLHGKARFDFLFEHITYVNTSCFRMGYSAHFPQNLASAPVMFAVVAPKRIFRRANRRNLVKRRVREAWRQIRPEWEPRLTHLFPLAIILIWKKPATATVRMIQDELILALSKLTLSSHEVPAAPAQ